MIHIVLVEPEIPPNTGNVIRLAANTGVALHLVEPLGFPLDDSKLRRAGLDYHEFARVQVHPNWPACKASLASSRLFALTTKGSSSLYAAQFQDNDAFVFGPETRGLSAEILAQFEPAARLRIPMQADSRSLNLSNSVAVCVYEALRQLGLPNLA
jgi:tRNA (cytidine/uridine-2'-O-)-methyltransferase